MQIINLTPHEIVIYDLAGKAVIGRFPPSGMIARVNASEVEAFTVDGMPVMRSVTGEVEFIVTPSVGDPCPDCGEPLGEELYCQRCGGHASPRMYEFPREEDGTFYIVSSIVRGAMDGRSDLISPWTAPRGAVRDAAGKILGTRGFQV